MTQYVDRHESATNAYLRWLRKRARNRPGELRVAETLPVPYGDVGRDVDDLDADPDQDAEQSREDAAPYRTAAPAPRALRERRAGGGAPDARVAAPVFDAHAAAVIDHLDEHRGVYFYPRQLADAAGIPRGTIVNPYFVVRLEDRGVHVIRDFRGWRLYGIDP